MEKAVSQLTVFFEAPFWVGVFECGSGRNYEVCRVVFGAEPKDSQVYELLNKHWRKLHFTQSAVSEENVSAKAKANPKRMQRAVKRQLQQHGIGTKAQQALKLQQEQGRQARKTRSKAQRQAAQEYRFALLQQKRREKHKGH